MDTLKTKTNKRQYQITSYFTSFQYVIIIIIMIIIIMIIIIIIIIINTLFSEGNS